MATIQELESFKLSDAVDFHKELNPRLWDDEKLDPEVRDQLLLIAEDFVEYLGLDNLKVEDVTISGSNAAYSYTPHSDLDLHILVDFNKLPDDPVYQELFTAKKTLYNDLHDISVREVPVELYVQDTNNSVQSLGEYSIVHDKWIRIPKKRRANFDEAATKLKYEKLGDLIELALKSRDPKRVKDTIDLVKRYRKAGLEKAGEFGPENLAFKAIRKQGLIQDLYDLKAELHGEKLSIEEASSRDDALIKIKKLLNTAGRTDSEKANIKSIISKMMKQWNIDPKEVGIRQPVDPVKAKMAKDSYEKAMSANWDSFKKGTFAEDTDNKKAAVLKIQKHLNKKYGANLDLDGKLGPLTLKSINKFMPRAKKGLADEPNKTTAVQGKKLKESSGAKIDAHREGDTIWINYFEVPVKGKGLGRAEYEKFEKSLPKDIKKIRLVASDAGHGPTHEFWDRMGFDYAYPDDDNEMVKLLEVMTDLRVYKNPSPKQLYRLTQRSAHKHMRGMYYNGDTYWWDANDAIHKQGSDYLGIPYDYQQRMEAAIDSVSDNYRVGGDDGVPQNLIQKYDIENELVYEASGYIPNEKEKNDPRFKTALTVDVRPDAIKKNAKAFGFKTSRAGIPPQARADGKIAEDLMREFKTFLSESTQPKIGYHVTAAKNLPIIQKDGIKADKRGNSYIWDSREMAEWFMDFQNDEGQDRTILKIDMSGLDARPDPEAEDMSEWSSRFKPGTNGGAWIISGPIPPNKIIG